MSVYADQGTAAHWVLEQCLVSIYEWKMPARAQDWVGQNIEIKDDPHARLSPSGAKRWMTCAAAPGMEEKYPEESEDTVRHVVFSQDDANAVQVALDYVETRVKELTAQYGPVTVRTEHRVPLKDLLDTDQCDGICDITLVCDGFIETADYKHGRGVPVLANDPQLKFYLAGTMLQYRVEGKNFPFHSARRTVIQPRCDKIAPRIRSEDVDGDLVEWMLGFKEEVLQAIAAVDAAREVPVFTPSEDACRFCSVGGSAKYSGNPVCDAYAAFTLAAIGVGDPSYQACEKVALQDVHVLSPEDLRAILDVREMLTGMLSAAEAWALNMLREGTAPENVLEAYKLIRGSSRRRWIYDDDAETVKALKRIRGMDPTTGKKRALGKKELYLEKLDSPAGIERRFKGLELTDTGRDALKAIIVKPEGKLTLVPRSDSHEEVILSKVPAEAAMDGLPDGAPDIPER